jgi:hypothetical protein
MSVTSLLVFGPLLKLLLFRCKSHVRDVVLCVTILSSSGLFSYVCLIVNIWTSFLDSVTLYYAKFALLVSLDRTIRGL